MKKVIPFLSFLLLFFNCTEDVLLQDAVFGANQKSSYSGEIQNNNWLFYVQDNTLLKDISLVGSHDAGAYKKGGGLALCQQNDIATQLQAGVRYLDIRLNYMSEAEDLKVYHGIVSQDLTWENDIYQPIADFLNNNPSEFVFVTLKNENGENEDLWKAKVLNSLNQKQDKILSKISNKTTLKEARGKIIILNRSYLDNQYNPMYGIRYNAVAPNAWLNQNPMYFADVFQVPTLLNGDITAKFNVFVDGLNAAQAEEFNNHFIVNNANGTSLFAYPNAVAERINPRITEYILNNQLIDNTSVNRFGYGILDFATSVEGKKVIDAYIAKTIQTYGK